MQSSSKYSSILLIEASGKPINSINYFDDLGNRENVKDSIIRIVQEKDTELVVTAGGLKIPIDKIHSVDGEISPNYTDEFFKCDCV